MFRKVLVPINEVIDLYVNQRLSASKLGKLFNVSYDTILARLRDNGVHTRTRSEILIGNKHGCKGLPIYKNERTGHVMSRCEHENVKSGLTTRGTVRKRRNYGQVEKVCHRCGQQLVVGENISAHSYRYVKDRICKQCHTIDVQINYALHRRERIEYGKNRQGITADSKCEVDGCKTLWYILNVHHMPDGILKILCPNHHALWHFDNGKVVRKNRFSSKAYQRWSEISCPQKL